MLLWLEWIVFILFFKFCKNSVHLLLRSMGSVKMRRSPRIFNGPHDKSLLKGSSDGVLLINCWGGVGEYVSMSVATDILVLRRPRKRPWLSGKFLDTIDAKKKARLQNNQHEYRWLKRIFKAMAMDDLENFYNGLADEAEESMTHDNLRPTYCAISRMHVSPSKLIECVTTKCDGTSCASIDETLNRWREHYQTMLKYAPADTFPNLDTQSSTATPSPLIRERWANTRRGSKSHPEVKERSGWRVCLN